MTEPDFCISRLRSCSRTFSATLARRARCVADIVGVDAGGGVSTAPCDVISGVRVGKATRESVGSTCIDDRCADDRRLAIAWPLLLLRASPEFAKGSTNVSDVNISWLEIGSDGSGGMYTGYRCTRRKNPWRELSHCT